MFCRFYIELLIDSGYKIYAMYSSFARKLGPRICKINVGAQTIRLLQPFPTSILTL